MAHIVQAILVREVDAQTEPGLKLEPDFINSGQGIKPSIADMETLLKAIQEVDIRSFLLISACHGPKHATENEALLRVFVAEDAQLPLYARTHTDILAVKGLMRNKPMFRTGEDFAHDTILSSPPAPSTRCC